METIYKLALHESMEIEAKSPGGVIVWYRVLRVPGGWIYMLWDIHHEVYTSPIFVPFNQEFE